MDIADLKTKIDTFLRSLQDPQQIAFLEMVDAAIQQAHVRGTQTRAAGLRDTGFGHGDAPPGGYITPEEEAAWASMYARARAGEITLDTLMVGLGLFLGIGRIL